MRWPRLGSLSYNPPTMETRLHFNDSLATARGQESPVLDILGICGLIALGALIRLPLPFTPVPLTLQTFVVLLAPFVVGQRRAFLGIGLYIVLGLAGTPLFAVASGVSLGYLAAFLAVPWVVGRFATPLAGMAAASVLIYALGAGWLWAGLGLSPGQAAVLGVLPFVPGDLLKVAAAAKAAQWLNQRRP